MKPSAEAAAVEPSTAESAAVEPAAVEPQVVETLVVGAFVGPHGVRGDLKLRPLTEFPERIPQLKELRLRLPDGSEQRRRVRSIRDQQGVFVLHLEGVETRDAAEALRGTQVVVDLADAAPLPEGRYYEHQILGLRVVTPEGEELGVVRGIIPGVSNDVYVAGDYMIPATHDAIARLAPEEGIIVVHSKAYLEGEEVR
ncbi:MAG: rRNA processing protein RimM [Armatimonadetes bacterium]|nr:rRNA processing protein RimM [Armatimonadota bacterium]